ncbi:hypothetical protein EGW08_003618 [Elysia chlorotica]|uniref:Uncharacterized protein n=1 Tax=Elysia chlorotica TaxID=188477 RepID=A0A3S1BTY1_ELYCH|nr:hypothetical protein EGW08_003618 [Elysia chlorotica]
MLTLIWICLAMQACQSELKPTLSVSGEPVPIIPGGRLTLLPDKAPVEDGSEVNDSRTQPSIVEFDGGASYTSTKPSSRYEIPANHICTHFKVEWPTSKGEKDELATDPLTVSSCSKSGAVVDRTFMFLLNQFQAADCGNQTVLSRKAEALYCSILHSHWMCLGTAGGGKKPKHSNDRAREENTRVLLPVLTRVRNAVDFLCRARHDFDEQCVVAQIEHVKSCIHKDVRTILARRGEQWSYGGLEPCKQLEVTAVCTYETLRVACTERDASVLTSLVAVYLTTPSCSLSAGVRISLGWPGGYVVVAVTVASKLFHLI